MGPDSNGAYLQGIVSKNLKLATEAHGNNSIKTFFFRVFPCVSVARYLSKCPWGMRHVAQNVN